MSGLQRLNSLRVPHDQVVSGELADRMCQLSRKIRRPIGVALTRRGMVQEVMVGSEVSLSPSTITKFPGSIRSLRGLRLIRTQLRDQPLSAEALTDLALWRFDLLGALSMAPDGAPGRLHMAHLIPHNGGGQEVQVQVMESVPFNPQALRFDHLIEQLDHAFRHARDGHTVVRGKESALLVSASVQGRLEQEERLTELAELAASADITVVGCMIQRVTAGHHRSVIGSGKLKEVLAQALQKGADMVIFDQTLSPGQFRAIAQMTDHQVIDRTQLILKIFARRAHSREGKLQVELAHMRYRLPRLSGQGTELSRLGGGIGTRGPGEAKLETDRRRIRDRIMQIERELKKFATHQDQRRARRGRHDVPVISLVGYTNAGKSTLLNALTDSQVSAGDRMFETLDTTSRRLRFPRDREVILTDTVGFIRDLPQELLRAFRTTLEELRDADLLLHVVDAGAPNIDLQIKSVIRILEEVKLDHIPRLLVFNKCDRLLADQVDPMCRRYQSIGISALHRASLKPLLTQVESKLSRTKEAFAA